MHWDECECSLPCLLPIMTPCPNNCQRRTWVPRKLYQDRLCVGVHLLIELHFDSQAIAFGRFNQFSPLASTHSDEGMNYTPFGFFKRNFPRKHYFVHIPLNYVLLMPSAKYFGYVWLTLNVLILLLDYILHSATLRKNGTTCGNSKGVCLCMHHILPDIFTVSASILY